MDFLSEIKAADLPEEQLAIAEIVGMDKYIKLIRTFGGNSVYIMQGRTLIKAIRDEQIRKDFTGRNVRQLAIRYRLSSRSIRNIIGPKGGYK